MRQPADSVRRAVIDVNPDAVQIAEKMDQELAEGKARGPLHGMPFLAKDVSTADIVPE